MHLALLSALVLATTALAQAAGGITVSPLPTLTQCDTVTVSWTGGTGPYSVFIYNEFYLSEESYLTRLTSTTTSVDWTVDIPATSRVQIAVGGAGASYDDLTFAPVEPIAAGSDSACLAGGPIGTAPISIPTASGTEIPTPSIPPPPGQVGSSLVSSISASKSTSASRSASASASAPASASSSSAAATATSSPAAGGTGAGSKSTPLGTGWWVAVAAAAAAAAAAGGALGW